MKDQNSKEIGPEEMPVKRILGLLGLCARAGKLSSGGFSTEKSIKSGQARLCLLASDASDATIQLMQQMCASRNIRAEIINIDKDSLGHAVGKEARSSVTVEDSGFAEQLIKLIEGSSCL